MESQTGSISMANFYTDVILSDARVNSVNRVHDPNLLEPATREAVNKIISDAAAMGITLMMFETYRSCGFNESTMHRMFAR